MLRAEFKIVSRGRILLTGLQKSFLIPETRCSSFWAYLPRLELLAKSRQEKVSTMRSHNFVFRSWAPNLLFLFVAMIALALPGFGQEVSRHEASEAAPISPRITQ